MNVRSYTAAFNLRGAAQEKRVGDMSGGERNRVHLAKVMSVTDSYCSFFIQGSRFA